MDDSKLKIRYDNHLKIYKECVGVETYELHNQ
jgi:hypothetical protein